MDGLDPIAIAISIGLSHPERCAHAPGVLLVQRIQVALIQPAHLSFLAVVWEVPEPSASPATCPAVRVFFGVVSLAQGTRDPVRWRPGVSRPQARLE